MSLMRHQRRPPHCDISFWLYIHFVILYDLYITFDSGYDLISSCMLSEIVATDPFCDPFHCVF
jgi:hypothetical protein